MQHELLERHPPRAEHAVDVVLGPPELAVDEVLDALRGLERQAVGARHLVQLGQVNKPVCRQDSRDRQHTGIMGSADGSPHAPYLMDFLDEGWGGDVCDSSRHRRVAADARRRLPLPTCLPQLCLQPTPSPARRLLAHARTLPDKGGLDGGRPAEGLWHELPLTGRVIACHAVRVRAGANARHRRLAESCSDKKIPKRRVGTAFSLEVLLRFFRRTRHLPRSPTSIFLLPVHHFSNVCDFPPTSLINSVRVKVLASRDET